MAKRKRTSNVEHQTPNVEQAKLDLPPELALDDAGPPPTDAEQLEGFKQHVAEQGREVMAEITQTTPPVVLWQDPRSEPQQGPAVVAVEVPLAPVGDGYATKHVEVRLTAGQAGALRRLCDALEHAGARVPVSAGRAPRPVQSAADGVRWLLEQLANAGE